MGNIQIILNEMGCIFAEASRFNICEVLTTAAKTCIIQIIR